MTEATGFEVRVWLCHRCGNYYGSKSEAQTDLTRRIVGQKDANFTPTPEKAHPRSRCPECGADRVPHTLVVTPDA